MSRSVGAPIMRQLLLTFALTACGSATARLEMSNQTPMPRSSVLADGTSLRRNTSRYPVLTRAA
jgi:hypothetical protein